ncbi:hypothetical protein OPAG_07391 [Rhodococcus opacus PD630]|uniref:hypothetical protein n=1 Tax=Rhodococcus TaxID=1827 RepID=UPI00029CD02E|nr:MULTISPECIES: hypothetical protein [Rhodococcus]KXF52396.1 hypothetical protein AXA44_10800 [Rhodococcus sp. SC4]PBC56098.1 hypothetical protein CJ177_22475 [Rhodococcus sp. ACPA1]RZK83215.1 MAG: hypothetical protein EOP26_13165 [Rhodococcus sp. (in: high G+C Gram-positive bacteria)]EHI41639.1 hypothetical protein OPAG_07391 [Rhodococcus opacus PD630]KXX55370.1 hypothetical protein AZG88_19470 [Rhodococcus sp. LB1]
MTRLQVAAAVVVGYWLGRAHRKKLGLLLAAVGAGRLAGGPQEMVDRAAKLLQTSPEFAELSESVRGQLLDAVKVAAMTAVTARVDALNNRLLSGSDAVLETAEDLVEDTAGMAGDVTDDTVDTVEEAADDTVGTVRKLADDTVGMVGALGRRKRPKKAPPSDDVDDEASAEAEDEEEDEERPARRPPRKRSTPAKTSGSRKRGAQR